MSFTAVEIPPQQRQAIIDEEHLKILSVGFWVSAGMSALFAPFGLMYMLMGLAFSHFPAMPDAQGHMQGPPPQVGWILGAMGFLMCLVMTGVAVLTARAAWCMKRRRSRLLCQIAAGVNCFFIPYGTALGVFAFMVLNRESVVGEFEAVADL